MLSRFACRLLLSLPFVLLVVGCAAWPADVEVSLSKAGGNRAELERVLKHYQRLGDPQKLEAAQFLGFKGSVCIAKGMQGDHCCLWYNRRKSK